VVNVVYSCGGIGQKRRECIFLPGNAVNTPRIEKERGDLLPGYEDKDV